MTPRQARLGVDVFTGAVIASVAIALAGLSWRIAGDPGTGPAVSPPATAGGGPVDLAPIIALAPFGSAVAADAGTAGQAMELRGILLANPIEASSVLIAFNNGPVSAFRIGQPVGGGTIETVAIDHVMLRTADGLQKLTFPERPSGAAAPTATASVGAPPAAVAPGVAAIRALIPEAVRGTPQPGASAAPPPAANSSGASPFLDSLGATATPDGGYRVGASASPAMQAAGLRPGDVIDRVNGSKLGNGAQDQQLITSAMASGSARIEVMRNGQRVTLSVPLR
jgi:general secretion pathway protein C